MIANGKPRKNDSRKSVLYIVIGLQKDSSHKENVKFK